MRIIKSCWGLIAALVIVAVLSTRWGLLPAAGPLLNPYSGVWKRTPGLFEAGSGELKLKGLSRPVKVVVDKDQVKHVFAANDHDLYEAQGFILASERLWQMEFLVRTASGRLSEVMGPKALDFDIYFTRIGLPAAAEASAILMLADPVTGPALQAYADGVNAYIASLAPPQYPFEYKLLGHAPRPWRAKEAAYLLKFMAWSLNGRASDVTLSRSLRALGRAGFDELFPIDLKVPEPIIPEGTKQIETSVAPPVPASDFEPSVDALKPLPTPHPFNGSNNWAVSGKKSTTGLPILSNDIHLGLSLPALWYEMQLVSDKQNVYGIALPGAPGIILGFNRSIAWGATNGGDDVMDYFQLRFRDQKRSEYLFDGNWRPVISREVKIPVRGRDPYALTLRETHFGPIVYDINEKPISPYYGPGLAIRWATLTESNELKNFLMIDKAKSLAEFRQALEGYQTPAQNFLVADNQGNIGLWEMGRFPLKWKGQGRLIGDGSDSRYDWKGFLTSDEVPSVKNPPRGFISSANEPPFEFSKEPHYLGWPFESPWRSQRINELLRAKPKFAPEDFIAMQRDTLAISTRTLLPILTDALKGQSLSADEDRALEILRRWDYRYEESSNGAPLAYSWSKQIELGLWARLLPERESYAYPPLARTIEILRDEHSRWFDDPATEKIETRADLVHAALTRAIKDVSERTGTRDAAKWTWAEYRPMNLQHFGKIPGLGHDDIPAAGMEHAIFANSGTHGPVWKMVVAVGPKPKAFGVYPGGQSGDPFSPFSESFVSDWRKGTMKPLDLMMDASDLNDRKLGVVSLTTEAP